VLVGKVRVTWPLLVAVPLLLWIIAIGLVNGFTFPEGGGVTAENGRYIGLYLYEDFVPHWLIYSIFFPTVSWVLLASFLGGRKLWRLMGDGVERAGSFVGKLIPAILQVLSHQRFDQCTGTSNRRWGHFFMLWGFIGALVTTTLAVIYLYAFHYYPVPMTHPMKWLGNLSSVVLILGAVLLMRNRRSNSLQVGGTSAFDRFFLSLVVAVIFTGVLTEAARFLAAPPVGCIIYLLHLSAILLLFFTFPYSKFAHLLYRMLAMVHQMMVEEAEQGAAS
jgi:quinone-modifying oxidoreductase subunit QmoC